MSEVANSEGIEAAPPPVFEFHRKDSVLITSGDHKGKKGTVIDNWIDDTFATGDVQMYLIEFPDKDLAQLSARYLQKK